MARKPAPKVVPYRGARKTTYRVRIRRNGVQTTETFDSFAAALAFAETVAEDGVDEAVKNRDRADRNSENYVPTVAEMLTKHIAELTGVDPRTKRDYVDMAARSWLPILGKVRVDRMDRAQVARFVNARDGIVKPKTIRNEHSLLSSVLETSVQHGHLATNPARGTRLPRSGEEDAEDIRFLTHAEFDRLMAEVPERWKPFVIFLFGTGLRFSEAAATQVQDVNPEQKTLRVMRTWKKDTAAQGGRRIGPPKSRESRRTIWVDEVTLETVQPLMRDRGATEFLFTTLTGLPVRHSNFYHRIWVPSCRRAGLATSPAKGEKVEYDGPRIHDARHTHASWLIANGVRLEVIQDRLGHKDYAFTRRVYGHLMPDLRREAGMAAGLAFAQTALGQRRELTP